MQESKVLFFNIRYYCYEYNVFVSEWFELFSKSQVFYIKRILGL